MTASVLSCRFRHRRGDFALDVAFEAPPGITALWGPSGAGKTTTLAVVSGLLSPDEGEVRLGDQTWLDTSQRASAPVHERRVAYLFQSLALFPHMTAEENVLFAMERRAPRAERRARARAILDRLFVGKLADRYPATFSGGEAQRVALARALATEPRVMLLDEPFSALDEALREELHETVRATVAELSVPALFVTHDEGEARALATRVLFFESGRITSSGTPDEALTARGRSRST